MTQENALSVMKMGYNVFLTGQPGAGKTYVLNQYINYLKSHKISAAVTASTGIAATHIGGTTIHSWSGLGIRKGLSERQLDDLFQTEYLVKRIEAAEVLIIDEISMLSGVMLDDVNRICQTLRRNDDAFGGLQVILVGDFFQLPPITRDGQEPDFAYESEAWQQASMAVCYLTEQHRQADGTFLEILSQLRRNNLEQDAYDELLQATSRTFDGEIEPVRLFTHNANVDLVNQERLDELNHDLHTFKMIGKGKSNHVERLIKSCLSPEWLDLKENAVVMATKNNFEAGYVNGSMGHVIDIDKDTGHPLVKFTSGKEVVMSPAEWAWEDDGKTIASIAQVPLRLAWAITVHKSQGMSIDRAEIDLSRTFEYGQGYVALSRVRSLDGLRLLGLNDMALMVNPKVMAKDIRFQRLSEAAEERLENLDDETRVERQKDFIVRTGGVLEAVEVKESEPVATKPKISTYELTKQLVEEKKTLKEIAKERDLTKTTIMGHLEKLLDKGELKKKDIAYLKPRTKQWREDFKKIKVAFKKTGEGKLTPVRKLLDNEYTFEELHFARLFI